jgi:hypothetical protein
LEDPPDLGGRAVAQDGARAEGERGGHQVAAPAEVRVADGVDPLVYAVKPSPAKAARDRTRCKPDADELPPGDDPELPPRQPGDHKIHWALSLFHVNTKGAQPSFSPPELAEPLQVGAFVVHMQR